MAKGEVVKLTFSKVFESPGKASKTDVPTFPLSECCFSLPALADATSDKLTNDVHTVIAKYDKNLYSAVTIFLQKYVNGVWQDVIELTDDTYGTNYSFGTITDSDNRLKYVAYHVEWSNVLSIHSSGTYRFRFKEIDNAAIETESVYLFEFCLKEYFPHRADFTTRFDWYTKGFRGDAFVDSDIWDFTLAAELVGGDGWFNQLRLPDSFFGYNKSNYEREFIKYSNGQQQWLKDEQVESYVWNSGQYPEDLHNFIKTNILQADRIFITDYNKNNPNTITNKAVNADGNYEPEWQYNNLKAFVNVDFVQEIQNRRKLRC